jgi:hypothetical protein
MRGTAAAPLPSRSSSSAVHSSAGLGWEKTQSARASALRAHIPALHLLVQPLPDRHDAGLATMRIGTRLIPEPAPDAVRKTSRATAGQHCPTICRRGARGPAHTASAALPGAEGALRGHTRARSRTKHTEAHGHAHKDTSTRMHHSTR